MDDFGIVYDGLINTYGMLEGRMMELFDHIKSNPNDEAAKMEFSNYKEITRGLLKTLYDAIDRYADATMKGALMSSTESKERALMDASAIIFGNNAKTK